MMKKTLAFLFILVLQQGYTQTKQVITLDDCYNASINNYPNLKQMDMDVQISKLNKQNIQANYLPSLNLNGQVSYQSDVTKVPISVPGINIPIMAKDWYNLNLDVEQLIYDGGLIHNRKKIADADLDIAHQKLQIEFYQLKDQVNRIYFGIILSRKTIEILAVLKKNLEATIADAEVAFNNGVLLSSDVDALKVEYNLVLQQIVEKHEDQRALIAGLHILTALDISNADQLVVPDVQVVTEKFVNNRPEYMLLGKQQTKIEILSELSKAKQRPVFMAFGQAGYGRPGYDMLNDKFDTYYKVGARLHWNIWDWHQVKRERSVLSVQNEIINTQKQSFDQKLKADLETKMAAIRKAEQLISTDETIVSLQQNVVNTANVQLKNGSLTTTNYVIELNKQVKAQLNLEVHKLQLVYSKYQYNITLGNL
ncbi:MAG: TolC family protein [Bacteroidales bacterium]|nr:TolC family protein [Bacteroidales bacterium]